MPNIADIVFGVLCKTLKQVGTKVLCSACQASFRLVAKLKKKKKHTHSIHNIKNKNNPEIQSLLRSMLCHLASTPQLFQEIWCHQNAEKYSSVQKASHTRNLGYSTTLV